MIQRKMSSNGDVEVKLTGKKVEAGPNLEKGSEGAEYLKQSIMAHMHAETKVKAVAVYTNLKQ